jgi:hypothetical protein
MARRVAPPPSSVVPRLMERLNDDYDELVQALRQEKEAQDREIEVAWAEIERERALIRQEWRRVEDEKARLFISNRGGSNNLDSPSKAGVPPLADQPVYMMRSSTTPMHHHHPHQHHEQHVTAIFRSPSAASEKRHYGHGAHALVESHKFDEALGLNRSAGDPHGFNNCISVWSGISRAASPRRLVLGHFRTMKQLLERAAVETGTQPVSEHLLTPDGFAVTRLDELEAGKDYLVLPSGCRYKEDTVPTQLLRKLVESVP